MCLDSTSSTRLNIFEGKHFKVMIYIPPIIEENIVGIEGNK